jgi:uncharacterized protein (TIGR02996 family)
MRPEDEFLHAIRAEPEEDAPRLVFADWLEEHGRQARAEFIRAQCAVARLSEGDPHREALRQRAWELLQRHRAAWVRPCRGWVRRGTFRRGFIERVVIQGDFLPDPPSRHDLDWLMLPRIDPVQYIREPGNILDSLILPFRYEALPIRQSGRVLVVAVASIENTCPLFEMSALYGIAVEPVLADQASLSDAIRNLRDYVRTIDDDA